MSNKVKIKLGKRPEKFAPINCAFKTPEGDDAEIKAVFKYRTRKEYAALQSEYFAADTVTLPKKADGRIDFEALSDIATANDATLLKSALVSWDLEDELSVATLEQLANDFPGAAVALKAAYAAACNEGRLGN